MDQDEQDDDLRNENQEEKDVEDVEMITKGGDTQQQYYQFEDMFPNIGGYNQDDIDDSYVSRQHTIYESSVIDRHNRKQREISKRSKSAKRSKIVMEQEYEDIIMHDEDDDDEDDDDKDNDEEMNDSSSDDNRNNSRKQKRKKYQISKTGGRGKRRKHRRKHIPEFGMSSKLRGLSEKQIMRPNFASEKRLSRPSVGGNDDDENKNTNASNKTKPLKRYILTCLILPLLSND